MNSQDQDNPPTIFVVSGGTGTSGEQLVRTVMAQFQGGDIRLIVIPHVHYEQQLDSIIESALEMDATLVHTMVDERLRKYLSGLCEAYGIFSVDLMGTLFERLEERLGIKPLGQPGLYRKLNLDYFERVAAIEYAMAHDDGKQAETWHQADILLVGVSRVGKTPLSLLLSVMGWKTANYPYIPEIEPPEALFKLDPGRVIGLTIEPGQLVLLRQERQRRLGVSGTGGYSDPRNVFNEVETARQFFKRYGFTTLDVTDRPLESTADEVIRLITSRYTTKNREG